MEKSAQVEVLAQLLGQEEARRVVALVTLAEAVVGLSAEVRQLAAERDSLRNPQPIAVYAPEDEEATP